MRGYDGYDINREHVDNRNKVQAMEASIFNKMFPDTPLLAAQVEDVMGTNVTVEEARSGASENEVDKVPVGEYLEEFEDVEKNGKEDEYSLRRHKERQMEKAELVPNDC